MATAKRKLKKTADGIVKSLEQRYIKGYSQLASYTGFKDPKVHQQWRREGLQYGVSDGNLFVYDRNDVDSFIQKRYFNIQQVKPKF